MPRPGTPHGSLPGRLPAVLAVISLLLSAGNASAAFLPYVPPFNSFSPGGSSMRTADLNRDGHDDLVVGDRGGNRVSVLLGNGDGTFQAGVNYPTGVYPNSVAVGDLNGDDWPDVVTANGWPSQGYGNSVSVLLGNGDGTLAAAVDYPVGDGPLAVQIAELNGDDHPDVACVFRPTTQTGNLAVLPGNGDGTLGAIVAYPVSPGPQYMAVGDLNEDGRNDVVVVAGTVAVLLADAGGGFLPQVTYVMSSSPVSVAIGDLNGDGRPDVAVGRGGSNFAAFPVNPNGTLGTRRDVIVACCNSPIVIGDFTEDGLADVAGNSAVVPGNGDYTFGPRLSLPSAALAPAAGDWNGDGRTDLALAGASVTVLLANRIPVVGARTDFPSSYLPSDMVVADLDEDGSLDVAAPNAQSSLLSIFPGNGIGGFGARVDRATGTNPVSVAAGDVNGDGWTDLATANTAGGSVSLFLSTGAGTFAPRTDHAAANQPSAVALADLNGDLLDDVLVADHNAHALSVFAGRSDGGLEPRVDYPTGYYPSDVAAGDLDLDGRIDVAVTNASSNTVSVFLTTEVGVPAPAVPYPTGVDPRSVAVGDVNGDGFPDLVVANETSNTISVLAGDGSGGFVPQAPVATGSYPRAAVLADLNSDSIRDILVVSAADNLISLLPGTGGGAFGPRTVVQTGSQPRGLAVANMDGDSRPDLLSANGLSGTISLWLNTGPLPSAVGDPLPPGEKLRITSHANPTRGVARFEVVLPLGGHLRAHVSDLSGRAVGRLVDGDVGAGERTIQWNGRGVAGERVAGGIYFLNLFFDGQSTVHKFVWLGP
jgi:hypothetical protein